jgi:hypothetical protein
MNPYGGFGAYGRSPPGGEPAASTGDPDADDPEAVTPFLEP